MTTWSLILIYIILLENHTTLAKTDSEGVAENSEFIAPDELSDIEDVFIRGDIEYVFVNFPVNHFQASIMCRIVYKGQLALVKTTQLAKFLAEALSETNLLLDALWISAKLDKNKIWYWYKEHSLIQPVRMDILKLFVNYTESANATDRNCLSMGRKDHDVPHFPALACDVHRPIMCERPVNESGNGSTHTGWISLGTRLYKIFQERVTWEEASVKCTLYDKKSNLAVITNYKQCQQLGRYLLVGRPSLENAWIGGIYQNGHYIFQQEDIVLPNGTSADGYPPWRNGRIQKIDGCLLLDRHLANITLFVEARCERKRPYICYKKSTSGQDESTDVLIDEFGYRLYFNKLPWDMARDKCNFYKKKYQAKLAEIRERRIVNHMIYVMGENRTAVQHVWLGGLLDPIRQKWCWDSDRSLVNITILNWLKKSTTYLANIEQFNTCLDMDRENQIKAIHYGTLCDFEQNFVCMFPRDKLIQLEKDERNGNKTQRRKRRRWERYG